MSITNGDMADSTDKNGKYAGVYVWDSTTIKMAEAIAESTSVQGQELHLGTGSGRGSDL